MKSFEKQFKSVLSKYQTDCLPVFCPSLPEISESEFCFLEAYGLLSLTPAGDDDFYAEPTKEGLTYFVSKKENRRKFWKEHLVNFIGGFLSGVLTTVLAAVIVQTLL